MTGEDPSFNRDSANTRQFVGPHSACDSTDMTRTSPSVKPPWYREVDREV